MLILGHHQNNKMNSMTTFAWCKRGTSLTCFPFLMKQWSYLQNILITHLQYIYIFFKVKRLCNQRGLEAFGAIMSCHTPGHRPQVCKWYGARTGHEKNVYSLDGKYTYTVSHYQSNVSLKFWEENINQNGKIPRAELCWTLATGICK